MDDFMEITKKAGHTAELKRLADNHEVFKAGMGKLVFAPVDFSRSGLKILDSATADGTWLRDLRSSLPAEHQYFGIDIEPEVFPANPQGIKYKQQSISNLWPEDWNSSFDFVHQRLGLAGVGQTPMAEDVKNFVSLCRPGGWVQLVELNVFDPPKNGPAVSDFVVLMKEIFTAIGVGDYAQRLKPLLEDAGLEDVMEKRVRCPTGKKAKPELFEKSIAGSAASVLPFIAAAKSLPTPFTAEQLEGLGSRLQKELRMRAEILSSSWLGGDAMSRMQKSAEVARW